LKTVLVAVGGSLVTVPAAAIELGEVKVHSTLGQPLRASIAYALGPQEAISDACVTLQPNMGASGLPSVSRASMIVTDGVIAITGSSVIREPLMTMRINVRCPHTARLSREYMMFIDPAGAAAEPIAAPTAARTASQPQISAPVATQAPVSIRRHPVSVKPIAGSTRYQVQPGDSLSEIAQRVENRPVGVWKTVNIIFADNPDAFIENDPNKLKAGSWLDIPSFGTDEPVTVADEPTAVTAPVLSVPVVPAAGGTAYEPALDTTAAGSSSALADLRPGDVILDSNNPFVAPANSVGDESVVIPNTLLDGPVSTSRSPNVPVAIIRPTTTTEPATTNWMLWFAGSGLAIIAALLLFGRRFRLGSAPIAPAAAPRRQTDSDSPNIEAMGEVDVDIVNDAPSGENLTLDADLIVGTGLQEGTDVDLSQDLGFAAVMDLDLELPEEMSSIPELPKTDIVPTKRVADSSILVSEVLPDDNVDADDMTLITDNYAVSQHADYKILEQDYEDEMTATQVLNAEIVKAAKELAVRMEKDTADVATEEPLATVHELDVTAQMPAGDQEESSDNDDTGIDPTVNIEAEDKTIEMADNALQMPKDGAKTG
jgi:hypothetical protein